MRGKSRSRNITGEKFRVCSLERVCTGEHLKMGSSFWRWRLTILWGVLRKAQNGKFSRWYLWWRSNRKARTQQLMADKSVFSFYSSFLYIKTWVRLRASGRLWAREASSRRRRIKRSREKKILVSISQEIWKGIKYNFSFAIDDRDMIIITIKFSIVSQWINWKGNPQSVHQHERQWSFSIFGNVHQHWKVNNK